MEIAQIAPVMVFKIYRNLRVIRNTDHKIILTREHESRKGTVTYLVETPPHMQECHFYDSDDTDPEDARKYNLSWPNVLWFITLRNKYVLEARVAATKFPFNKKKQTTDLYNLPMPNQYMERTKEGQIPIGICIGSIDTYRDTNMTDEKYVYNFVVDLLNSKWNTDLGTAPKSWGVTSLSAWSKASAKNPEYYKDIELKELDKHTVSTFMSKIDLFCGTR